MNIKEKKDFLDIVHRNLDMYRCFIINNFEFDSVNWSDFDILIGKILLQIHGLKKLEREEEEKVDTLREMEKLHQLIKEKGWDVSPEEDKKNP